MTTNMEKLANVIITMINADYQDSLPTIENIETTAKLARTLFHTIYPVNNDEYEGVLSYLNSSVLHSIGHSVSLKGLDSDHKSWYFLNENDGFYWRRYRQYLQNNKHWSLEIVNRLNQTSDSIMDDLGNPLDKNRPFQRRGLLLGDVQSGKTATYTAICNKAADSGYRIIIVLAGMMENLRVQTQERLDSEFAGLESKYTLDKKAENVIRNLPVGVGKISPFDSSKRIACFTSVATDFNKSIVRALGLSLNNLNGTALFVVKKNKSILNNLYKWLIENNANEHQMIDLPLLLIDDEADNGSVNTNTEERDPTAINDAIRKILHCFKQASYLGITATPFANIFINPDTENDEATRDLFPKDFLTVLPTPDKYIGTDKIFGYGDADDWHEGLINHRKNGQYSNSLIPIENDEQKSFFVLKHKKSLADELDDLPPSLREAIRYFILATGITDYKNDVNEHRSMLVNVSHYTDVQDRVAELVEVYLLKIKADLENYSQLTSERALTISNIQALHKTWEKFDLTRISKLSWEEFLKQYSHKATRRIEVRSVNRNTGPNALNYSINNNGLRVIAVGGNSLSRGLTLEGLCVSYFYRNSQMYDTLLQMGRWFGYRANYEDLFKIWMGEDAINWYGYITDAVNELKDELKKMERQKQTPAQFGLKVRQAPGTLLITARNKMRTGTTVARPVTVSGRLIETPRLRGDLIALKSNEELCKSFIKEISSIEGVEKVILDTTTNAYIWRNVPKKYVSNLVRNYLTHPWNLNFQPIALSEYIDEDNGKLDYWDVAIPQSDECEDQVILDTEFENTIEIFPKKRPLEWDINTTNMLKVYGRHVRIGAGGCTKIGLQKEKIQQLREKYGNSKDSTFLMEDRNPLLLVHILKNTNYTGTQDNNPNIVYGLGLGFPYDGRERTANYVVNIRELSNWFDASDEDEADEYID